MARGRPEARIATSTPAKGRNRQSRLKRDSSPILENPTFEPLVLPHNEPNVSGAKERRRSDSSRRSHKSDSLIQNITVAGCLVATIIVTWLGCSWMSMTFPFLQQWCGSVALEAIGYYRHLDPFNRYLYRTNLKKDTIYLKWSNGTHQRIPSKNVKDHLLKYQLNGDILDLGHLSFDDTFAYANRLRYVLNIYNQIHHVKTEQVENKKNVANDPLSALNHTVYEGVKYLIDMLPGKHMTYTTLRRPTKPLSSLIALPPGSNSWIKTLNKTQTTKELTLPRNSYDFILLDWSLPSKDPSEWHHLMETIFLALKPGGRLLFIEPSTPSNGWSKYVQALIYQPICKVIALGHCSSANVPLLMSKYAWKVDYAIVGAKQSPFWFTPFVVGIAQKEPAPWFLSLL